MPRLKNALFATALLGAAAAVPAVVFAQSGAPATTPLAPVFEVIAVPVQMPVPAAFTGAPQIAAMIYQIDALQARIQSQMAAGIALQMAALQRLAMEPLPPPGVASAGSLMKVSMLASSAPGGYCSRSMTITPGPDGKARMVMREAGNACAPARALMPSASQGARTEMRHFLPPRHMAPPAKLIEARYDVPQAG